MKLNRLMPGHSEAVMGMNYRAAADLRLAFDAPELAATGRGPASGPDATPYSVALLLLGAWSGADRNKVAVAARRLFVAPLAGAADPADPPECPITGALVLGSAVQYILADPSLAARIDRIELRQGAEVAAIYAVDGTVSRFTGEPRPSTFRVFTVVDGAALFALATDLAGSP